MTYLPALNPFANLAALQALNSTPLSQGSVAYVQTLRANFKLDPTSSATPDGITIVAATVGRWIRVIHPDPFWQQQTAWFINSSTGNDENSGATSLLPLKTGSEYNRRTGYGSDRLVTGNVTITIQNNLPATDPFVLAVNMINPSALVVLTGVKTINHSGTLASYTTYAQPATPIDFNDNASLDFTPFVGQRVLMTSGAAINSMGTIVKAVSAGHARLDWLTTPNGNLDPNYNIASGGDTYQIFSIPVIENYSENITTSVQSNGTTPILVESIDFGDVISPDGAPTIGTSTLEAYYQYCNFSIVVAGLYATLTGCLVTSFILPTGGTITLAACGFLNASMVISEVSHVICFGVFCQNSNWVIDDYGTLGSHHLGTGLAFFDTDSCISFGQGEGGSVHLEGTIWGANNTSFIVNLTNGSRVVADLDIKLTATGSGAGYSDFIINGQKSLPAFDPSTGLWTANRPLSFANLQATVANGGFNGNVWDPGSPTTGIFSTASTVAFVSPSDGQVPTWQGNGVTGVTGTAQWKNLASRQTSDFVSTVTGPTGPANLSFPFYSTNNKAFSADFNINGSSGGVKLGMLIPSGAKLYSQTVGQGTGPTGPLYWTTTSGNSGLQLPAFAVGATGPVHMAGTVVGATGVTGTVQVVMGMAVAGQGGAILNGGFIVVYSSN